MRWSAILTGIGIFCATPSLANDARMQPPWAYRPNVDVAFGFNHINSDFSGLGSTSGSASFFRIATDIYNEDFWDKSLRYAGEFAGFRIAAAVGYTQGFGNVSEDLGGGITGKTDMGASFDFTVRAGTNVGIFRPYLVVGVAITLLHIKASPFESGSDWVPGFIGGVGIEMPWGAGVTQNIDQAATRLYLEYRHYENADVRISGAGGARDVDTDFDMVLGGVRSRF